MSVVIDLYTKRGLCHLHTINILTGYFVRRIVPISTEFVIPDVSRDLYQLTGISYKDDSMVDGFNDDKRVIVGIVTSLGQDAVYAVDVYQAGSANDIDFVAKNVGF
ncbi:hypothetical protein DY000_02024968 [Brassica cretica]|uniref:Uncharacterized protein n=1 Tax=Brassica cretica TaxID=69181 RepID=A0ABQ7EIY1_BRACR|nr:hypothetical protein DY000_02024968 [Brassica cretica]